MTDPTPARDDCEHHYETRILGGHPITVSVCTFCRTPDWPDLYEQAENLFQWGREEALAGKPPRERLSAYDMPREDRETGQRKPDNGCHPDCPARTALAEVLARLHPLTRWGGSAIRYQTVDGIQPATYDRWQAALQPAALDGQEQH